MKKLVSNAAQKIPVVKYLWKKRRERKIFSEHRIVVNFWSDIIQQYGDNRIEKYTLKPKKDFVDGKIIWQYWGQGLSEEDLPEVVRVCFASVDKYKGDYQVIRLTDELISKYIDFPDFVFEKRQNPAFKTVFFSDLLRLALLHAYGGIWLDATILLTAAIPEKYGEMNYFIFQRDARAKYKNDCKNSYEYYWNWHSKFRVNSLSSIFFAKKGSVTVSMLLDLMLYYWKTEEVIINYFFLQILYDELIKRNLVSPRCEIVDDSLPHLLQIKINGGLKQLEYDSILEHQSLHKLSYADHEGIIRLREATGTYL